MLYQIVHALGFQDLSSFIIAVIFLIAACAFVISGAIFLVKKHRERQQALLDIVNQAQEPKAELPKLEPKKETPTKPVAKLKKKTRPQPKLELSPQARPEPRPETEPEWAPHPEPAPASEPKTEPSLPEPTPAPEPESEPPQDPSPEPEPPHPEIDSKKALGAALKNTRGGFIDKIARLFSRGSEINDEDFESLEAILFTADIGAKTAQKLLDNLKTRVKAEKIHDKAQIQKALKEEMKLILHSAQAAPPGNDEGPRVFMFVGVNGAGKTTSIAKLGAKLAAEGKRVVFGAGDTFRAAAVQQLAIWGERAGIPVIHGKEGSDSASVLFEAISEAKRTHADAVLCDTAGRLHTKVELMDELKKVHKVVNKAQAGAPHEVLLVIDATMGQNAIAQAREFALATPLTGVVLSKLDGTAKGGVALGIVDELKVPIRYIGIGEQVADLKEFDADKFVDALVDEN
jgi:fused signal recognition particle receptor